MATKKVAELQADYIAIQVKSTFLTSSVDLTNIESVQSYQLIEWTNSETGEKSYTTCYSYKGAAYLTNYEAAKEARNGEIRGNINKLQTRISDINACMEKLTEVERNCNKSLTELHKDKESLRIFSNFFQEVQGLKSEAEGHFNSGRERNYAAIGCTPDGSIANATQGLNQLASFLSSSTDCERSATDLDELIQKCNKLMEGISNTRSTFKERKSRLQQKMSAQNAMLN